jgi:hypothetical protein
MAAILYRGNRSIIRRRPPAAARFLEGRIPDGNARSATAGFGWQTGAPESRVAGITRQEPTMVALAIQPDAATPAFSTDDARWEAVMRRDRRADGAFFCAVVTTGVYCRPSCAGRPYRKNVRFHPTPEAARRAGFRACKRCRPDEVRP